MLLKHDGSRLLFDPFFPLNGRVYNPTPDNFVGIEHIFITHGHVDHISGIPDIMNLNGGLATVYCTATPRKALISKGFNESRIKEIKPGNSFTPGSFEVRVLKGKHIVFNKWLIVKTLLTPRVLTHWNNAKYLMSENKVCIEAGETVVYDICASGKRVLLLGSLNLDGDTEYPVNTDLVILPFQGRSDIAEYALAFIERLQPKKVLLDHYDDTFPPISSKVDTGPFIYEMGQKHPGIPVICPQAGPEWIEL